MNTLEQIFSSRTRAGVFTILFGLAQRELHNREIARRSKHSEAAVRQELSKLLDLALVHVRRDGNRAYYSANRSHPLYHEIHSMVLKTTGLVDVLAEALIDHRIETAFVFGSIAEGRETQGSDVDILIIGSIGLMEVSRLLSGVSELLEREVNPIVMSREEYIRRAATEDHFANNVIRGARLFIKGDPDEFEAMGD
jgi:predicted nucleotidyltransferase